MLLLEVANRSLLIKNGTEMEGLLRDLCRQVPTQGMVAGLIPAPSENLKADEIPFINAGFSEEWLKKYQTSNYFSCDPIKRARLSGADFLRWSDTFAKAEKRVEREYIRQAREHDVYEGLTVGAQRNPSSQITFFSFIGTDLVTSDRDEMMLRYLAPYLHEAMCRVSPAASASKPSPLSERETEVLTWAMGGKTNWEISMILNISEHTVKFHIRNVMVKLEASSRAHAVAIALGLGLICS
ncbi:MAG TPA: LuxR C-terminal-related transcriptional regulator [Candidatus Angelobacter sp.]|nr:LuxR C-terminal-related transcriptional regulator [Candidatus Angelobacter sp.]